MVLHVRQQIALAGVLLGLALLAGPPAEARLNARGRARATKTRIAASAELRAREAAAPAPEAAAQAAAGASRRRHLQDDYTVLGASDGEEWNAEGQTLLDTGSESFSSGVTLGAASRAADSAESGVWTEAAQFARGPAELGNVEYLALAQLRAVPPAGYDRCQCHGNAYLLPWGSDCFDPWHLVVAPVCTSLCSCLAGGYDYSPVIKKCVYTAHADAANISLVEMSDAAALSALGSTADACLTAGDQLCVDDPSYRDKDGDPCEFYAAFPDPAVACNYEGYTEALLRCPVACGTCEALGLSAPGEQYFNTQLYTRFFNVRSETRSQCGLRNDLGEPEDAFNPPRIALSGGASVERCASACFQYVENGAHACTGFSVGSLPNPVEGGEPVLVCEFTSACEDPGMNREDQNWDTYTLRPSASDCDPTPGSPLLPDECGVCGGDNSTCQATLELLVDEPLPEAPPTLGSIVAGGPYMFGRGGGNLAGAASGSSAAAPPVHEELGSYSTVYCYLRLYGKNRTESELTFAFGSHPGGRITEFSMSSPNSDELGVVERATLYLVGGKHWLSAAHGPKFRGLRLQMTIALRLLEWKFELQQPLLLDSDSDVLTVIDWRFTARAQLPTSVLRCHNDCSRDVGMGTPVGGRWRDDSAFHSSSERSGAFDPYDPNPKHASGLDADLATGPWPGDMYKGCSRVCTNAYEMQAPQVWPPGSSGTRGRPGDECTPNLNAVCPQLHVPVCGMNGRTYRNRCSMGAHCVRLLHEGECERGSAPTDLLATVLAEPGQNKPIG